VIARRAAAYMMNADGTNTQKIDVPDKGYLIDPSWSPNANCSPSLAPPPAITIFMLWNRSRHIIEITRDSGRNERPSWAPDGRTSFRIHPTGTRQIWTCWPTAASRIS